MTMPEFNPNGYKTLKVKEKVLVASNFSFANKVFETLVLKKHKNQSLFGKGLTRAVTKCDLTHYQTTKF